MGSCAEAWPETCAVTPTLGRVVSSHGIRVQGFRGFRGFRGFGFIGFRVFILVRREHKPSCKWAVLGWVCLQTDAPLTQVVLLFGAP